jgi:molecular chaperone HscB
MIDCVPSSDQILKTCEDIEKFVEEKDWEKVKKATIRLKYLDGIQRAASEWRPASSARF